MSEFGVIWKHEKTQHAFVGLGSSALAAAADLPRYVGPNLSKGIIQCIKYKILKNVMNLNLHIQPQNMTACLTD